MVFVQNVKLNWELKKMTNSIYFLCSGNSCRSQMAEGYAKKYLPNWDIQSAGIRADGLNPNAIKVMAEDDIDISEQFSKIVDENFLHRATIIVTLCGEARDKCFIPQNARWIHWSIDDPALISGSNQEIAQAFIDTRNEIKEYIMDLAKKISN